MYVDAAPPVAKLLRDATRAIQVQLDANKETRFAAP
jgi:hypothetical protein